VLFPERPELEQDPNVQKAQEGNTDTASNGGLKRQQPDLNRTSSGSSRTVHVPTVPNGCCHCRHKTVWVGTCQYSFAAQMITRTAQLRWRTQKYSVS
jgi:hypothetical protein